MSKVEIGRYSAQLRRQLGMAGTEIVAAELSPEISATIQIEGESAEWDFLKSVRRAHCSTSLAAAVGFNARFRLRNPLRSGIIAVVTQLGIANTSASAALQVARGQEAGNLNLTLTTVVPDTRWGTGVDSAALLFSASNSVAIGQSGDVIVDTVRAVNEEFTWTSEVVLMPGSNLNWGTPLGTTNRGLTTWVIWKERMLPEIEAR